MIPAVHPDDAIGASVHAGHRVRNLHLRDRVENLQDSHVRTWPAHEVLGRMRLGLTLRLREDRSVPGFRLLAVGSVDGQTGIVAEFGAWVSVWNVFVGG